ncbi:hypothetical protein BDW02DRAFT_648763 [Decorospora gaudefroyi]|uniref:U6 snRNA phosphodiesterase n=1 Tax=Decorospora gaudefroyi TaxID=184978 RepID=A0A6A5K9J3_9PLEO|nr:hypothetical protein BDW02DRAFT_648763 [Decorospora gaudefroyi]
MALVDYPDSESGDDSSPIVSAQPAQSASKIAVKRKHSASAKPTDALPPLPSAFHDLYATNARVSTSDNPSLHGGRKRTVPHVEGVWPSHVYLEWIPSQAESKALHSLIKHIKDCLELQNAKRVKKLAIPEIVPSLLSELGASLPLHVSLSRTLQIKTEDRENFLDTLRVSLRKSAVRAFNFEFQSLKWVPNAERNRWFLVLGIKRPEHDKLNGLLHACNKAAHDSGHPGLYTGGKGDGPMGGNNSDHGPKRRKVDEHEQRKQDYSEYLHVTIAWNLAEPDAEWMTVIENIDISKYIQSPEAAFDAVKVKIGNAVQSISLATRRAAQRGAVLGLG